MVSDCNFPMQVCGSKKNVKSRRGLKPTPNGNNEEDTNAVSEGQSSSSISSEDDSNASQELNGGATSESKGSAALNSNGKTRASRGSATDPQSLYARVRNFAVLPKKTLHFSPIVFLNPFHFQSFRKEGRE